MSQDRHFTTQQVMKRIDAGEEMMIEFYIKTQEKLG